MHPRPARTLHLSVQSLEARDVPAAGVGVLLDPSVYVPNRVIVQMSGDKAPRSSFVRATHDLGNGFFSVDLRAGVGVQRGLLNLRAVKGVTLVEPDYIVRADLTPNDPNFGSLWGLNNTGQTGGTADADIDAPEAWDASTGSGSIPVGIIDTGMDYRHQDLYLNVWINQAEIPSAVRSNLVDTDGDGLITFYDLNNPVDQGPGKVTDLNGNGRIDAGDILASSASGGWSDGVNAGENGFTDDLVGWNFVSNNNNPFDDNNHGTHVAGTIGAIGNNGIGVAGINWRAQMAPLKFLSASGSGSTSGAISALNYAVSVGLKVTNNSWGGGGFSTGLSNAITAAQNAGQIFVAAAGNANSNNDSIANYPSNYPQPNVVAVGSSTSTDARSSFSNYGATTVDLFAPGSGIVSTTPNDTYSNFSGTSMATPHVTGAIALVWDAHPTWTYQQVIDAIKNTVDVKPAFQGISVTGGRLNVDGALRFSFADIAGPRVTSSVFSGTGNAIDNLRVTFNEPILAPSFDATDVSFTGPGSSIAVTVTPVSGSDTQFDVAFASQSTPGDYTMVIGPNITDLAGNAMNQNNNGTNGEVPGDQYTTTRNIPAPDTAGPRVTAGAFNGTSSISSLRFTFNEAVDPTTFDASDAAITGPGGTIAVSGVNPVSGSGNTQFEVSFAAQTAPGLYTMVIGPDIRDLAGNLMNQNNNGINGEVPGDQYTATQTVTSSQTFNSTDVNKTIRDVARTISVLTINQDITIADLNVTMNLSHTWDSDLRVTLIGPDGTSRILVNRRGGSGDNFSTTTFNDEAGVSIVSGAAPFNGSYRPEQSLTGFDGKNARGTWQLVVDDLAMFDTGRINSWSVTIQG